MYGIVTLVKLAVSVPAHLRLQTNFFGCVAIPSEYVKNSSPITISSRIFRNFDYFTRIVILVHSIVGTTHRQKTIQEPFKTLSCIGSNDGVTRCI